MKPNTYNNEYIDNFLSAPLTTEEKNIIQDNKHNFITDYSFEKELEFGTGGIRAIRGLGTNRINQYTVARVVMACSLVLKENLKENHSQKPLILVGFDSRIGNSNLVNTSFYTLKQYFQQVFVFNEVIPTPLFSFAMVDKKADMGFLFTASHNPPEYSGLKVYWTGGAQITSPIDLEIQKKLADIQYSHIHTSINQYLKEPIPEQSYYNTNDIINDYTTNILNIPYFSPASYNKKDISILYSPLHGVGAKTYEHVFAAFGYKNFSTLSSQKEPDGNFPTVKNPNPEEPRAFFELEKYAKKKKISILLASDPDADRLGAKVYCQFSKQYVYLTGHQICVLLLEHLAKVKVPLLKNPFFCKTIVTTDILIDIARAHGIRCVQTLTGFKYIANELKKDPDNFLIGVEESYGYLPVSFLKDKDSISSAVLLCNFAIENPLLDSLDEIYKKYGVFENVLYSQELPKNLSDKVFLKMQKPFSIFQLGDSIGSRKVIDMLYLKDDKNNPKYFPQTQYFQDLYKQLPDSFVLQYYLEPQGKITIRPSGTEPKIKIYLDLRSSKNNSNHIIQIKKELAVESQKILQEVISKIIYQ